MAPSGSNPAGGTARDVRRDYFVAESPQGEIMWIYRDHRYGIDDGEWFLHGVFA